MAPSGRRRDRSVPPPQASAAKHLAIAVPKTIVRRHLASVLERCVERHPYIRIPRSFSKSHASAGRVRARSTLETEFGPCTLERGRARCPLVVKFEKRRQHRLICPQNPDLEIRSFGSFANHSRWKPVAPDFSRCNEDMEGRSIRRSARLHGEGVSEIRNIVIRQRAVGEEQQGETKGERKPVVFRGIHHARFEDHEDPSASQRVCMKDRSAAASIPLLSSLCTPFVAVW